jgi:hypothetical protein
MKRRLIVAICFILVVSSFVNAQETEIKLSLSEQFFETLLSAVFENLDQPKVPLSLTGQRTQSEQDSARTVFGLVSYADAGSAACDETVRLKKEIDGVRTAVKFRNQKIYAPIAFEGSYNVPLLGCIDFSGWAETRIALSYDQSTNALIGKTKVLSTNLSGTNGIGSGLITRLVQNSIDKKINPLEIIKLDMLSFTAPIQNSGKLRMKAIGIRHVVRDREIDVYLKYRFEKAIGN